MVYKTYIQTFQLVLQCILDTFYCIFSKFASYKMNSIENKTNSIINNQIYIVPSVKASICVLSST